VKRERKIKDEEDSDSSSESSASTIKVDGDGEPAVSRITGKVFKHHSKEIGPCPTCKFAGTMHFNFLGEEGDDSNIVIKCPQCHLEFANGNNHDRKRVKK